MAWEHVPCAICGLDDTEVVCRKGDLTADITNVVCRRCGLVYMNPRPTVSEYRDFHVEDFLRERHGLIAAEQVAPKVSGSDVRMKTRVAAFIAPHLAPGARVLDVGCGFGALLHILKTTHGAAVTGIELAAVDVAAAKRFYGLDLFQGSVEEYHAAFPEQQFDCIVLHHTFEHLPDPRAVLGILRGMLTEHGFLYIGVPNVMNIKKRPDIFFQKGHPYSYSPSTLHRILQEAGFAVTAFNRRAAFPGAMEVLAAPVDHVGVLAVPVLTEGADARAVARHIMWTGRKFSLLRQARSVLTFWLPKNMRMRLSHRLLQIMKKL